MENTANGPENTRYAVTLPALSAHHKDKNKNGQPRKRDYTANMVSLYY